MRHRVWRSCCAIASVLLLVNVSFGQPGRRIDIEPGKFVALGGYVVQEDSLICRTPEKERELALTLQAAAASVEELNTLRQIAARHEEEIDLYKRIVARKEFVIQQQDSLIRELERVLEPKEPGFLRKLAEVFDRRTFFLIGFVAGVFAGVNVPGR